MNILDRHHSAHYLGYLFADVSDLCVPAGRDPAQMDVELARSLAREVQQISALDTRIGLAPQRFTAEQAARAARPHGWCPVQPGQERTFLSPLPLESLPLDPDMHRRLHLLGITTLGTLAALPRAAIVRQFGADAGLFHDLATGRDLRGVYPDAPPLVVAGILGVMIFQEQVLKVARDLAGFTPGQAEQLRRCLGRKRAEATLQQFKAQFFAGAQANGVSPKVIETVFAQMQAFGSYAFPKSHAAAFAVLTYHSAWLRCYHPAAFFAGLLRHQPMGFYSPCVIVDEARRGGIQIFGAETRFQSMLVR